ncbi:glycerophosphodiester phosphodiesterase [Leucobacter chinensis]|uniref:glycerophosphodiester phosphodiesterase n=1 Tax=Leucobacter chinensis TaxID=2851010 RepID=UPI001C236168|nr:glycerophosphodiester phosphodiesterase family protein [Leucobacter chinensis]
MQFRSNGSRRRRAVVIGAVAALVCSAALGTAALAATAQPNAHRALKADGVGVIAHRGAASAAPENTLASVRYGLEQDVEFVEIDVRLTKDEVPVLMHDSRVDRTTNGAGEVSKLTHRQIAKLDAGSWFSREYRGEPVPTFDGFLDVFVPERALAFVELKGTWRPAQIEALLGRVEARQASERIVWQSFDETTMRRLTEASPEAARVMLTKSIDNDLVSIVDELDIDGIGAGLDLIEQHLDIVHALSDEGVATFAYTLNDEIAWEAAETAGVDLIVTDSVSELQQWLER